MLHCLPMCVHSLLCLTRYCPYPTPLIIVLSRKFILEIWLPLIQVHALWGYHQHSQPDGVQLHPRPHPVHPPHCRPHQGPGDPRFNWQMAPITHKTYAKHQRHACVRGSHAHTRMHYHIIARHTHLRQPLCTLSGAVVVLRGAEKVPELCVEHNTKVLEYRRYEHGASNGDIHIFHQF